MPSTHDRHVVALPQGLCRRCVRSLSRRLRDLPGMVWFEIDAGAGEVTITGDVDLQAVAAAVSALRCP